MLGSIIEGNAPCNVVIGIAGDRWVATVLSFLAMTLATVGGFVNVSVDTESSSCLVIRVSQLTGLLCLGLLI